MPEATALDLETYKIPHVKLAGLASIHAQQISEEKGDLRERFTHAIASIGNQKGLAVNADLVNVAGNEAADTEVKAEVLDLLDNIENPPKK